MIGAAFFSALSGLRLCSLFSVGAGSRFSGGSFAVPGNMKRELRHHRHFCCVFPEDETLHR